MTSACVSELARHNANNGERYSGIHARNLDISLLRNLWMYGGTLATRAHTNRKKTHGSIKMLGQGAPTIAIYMVSCTIRRLGGNRLNSNKNGPV